MREHTYARSRNKANVSDIDRPDPARVRRSAALKTIGSVVYAVQLEGGVIKIGFTSNLYDRERTLKVHAGSDTAELLAFKIGTIEDERAIHDSLVEHRHHGREYYHPTPAVMAVVNEMRELLGMDPVAA